MKYNTVSETVEWTGLSWSNFFESGSIICPSR